MTLLNIGRKTIIFLHKMHDTEWLLAMFYHKNENIVGKGIFSLALFWILDHCEDQMKSHIQKHFEPTKWIYKSSNFLKNGVFPDKWKSCLLAMSVIYHLCLFISTWFHILFYNTEAL